jgi:hypothetical protein
MNPVKRDDVNMEIIDAIQKMYPGMEIKFAGQMEEMSEDIKIKLKKISKKEDESLFNGTCVDCDQKIPGEWPPKNDDYKLPEGWGIFYDVTNGKPSSIQCPKCNNEELNICEVE